MHEPNPTFSIFACVSALTGLKCLLIYAYASTDFEVHRNWLAVTHSLPFSRWYYDDTSPWTLDYPPLFAWFEYLLSFGAKLADAKMLVVQNLNYASFATVCFQRGSVIVVDLVYWLACSKVAQSLSLLLLPSASFDNAKFLLSCLLVGNVGLLFVDSVHFQYNGVLYGLLFLSVAAMINERFLMAAFWFTLLLNMKHIFLYVAPAYFVFLLMNYCISKSSNLRKGFRFHVKEWMSLICWENCLKLAVVLCAVLAISLGPFITLGQIDQLRIRLFPFKRGLTHAYWAPNFWALYNFADLCLLKLAKHFSCRFWASQSQAVANYTSGYVQEFDHAVLPSISPLHTIILSVCAMLPWLLLTCAKRVVKNNQLSSVLFLRLLVLCGFGSFLFGWHVHEKAVILVIVCLAPLAVRTMLDARLFVLMSFAGHYSLFPLLFEPFEQVLLCAAFLAYNVAVSIGLCRLHVRFGSGSEKASLRWCLAKLLSPLELLYVMGFVLLHVYANCLHAAMGLDAKAPFVPLLLTSVYCGVGVCYCWLLSCWAFLCDEFGLDVWLYKEILWKRQQDLVKRQLVLTNTEPWQDNILRGRPSAKETLRYVGGLDITMIAGDEHNGCACLTVLSYPDLALVYSKTIFRRLTQRYIPGFLAFREAPPLLELINHVRAENSELVPQVILIDGNGILHPNSKRRGQPKQRCGLACHVGVLSGIPTIGIAKNLHHLPGLTSQPFPSDENAAFEDTSLLLEETHAILGASLRSSFQARNPVFVSIGHKINLETALTIVRRCSRFRVPEPIRLADQISRKRVIDLTI